MVDIIYRTFDKKEFRSESEADSYERIELNKS